MTNASETASKILANSQIAFGTSGARGLVEHFSDEVCAAFTIAFLDEMGKSFDFSRVAVAIDNRPSSPEMAAAICEACHQMGYLVDYYGVLPTPALALQAMSDGIPSIMITGSHIPFDRNGIKFYRPDGEISKADEIAILHNQSAMSECQKNALTEPSSRAKELYIQRNTSLFSASALAGLRVGLYEHSAAGRDLNREVLEQLGATVISLGRTEQFVPIDTEAVSEEDCLRGRAWSEQHQLNAIFSTDGDGDRPLLADETGNWFRGDILGLLCAQIIGVDALAVPVSCNTAIELCGSFKMVKRTRIGSPYVIEAMKQLGEKGDFKAIAGFEANGGFLVGSDIEKNNQTVKALPTRDALLPALIVLTESKAQGKALSVLGAKLPNRFTVSDRLANFPTEKSKLLIDQWIKAPSLLEETFAFPSKISLIDLTDGLRIELDNGQIVHLRPSGNAPELRCYCEADKNETAVVLLKLVMRRLKFFAQ